MTFLFALMLILSLRAEAQNETLEQKVENARIFYQQGHLDETKKVYFDILSKNELSMEERAVVLYNIATILTNEGQYKEAERTFDLINKKEVTNPSILVSIEENRTICYLKMAELLLAQPMGHDNFIDRVGEIEKYIDMAKSSYDKASLYSKDIEKTDSFDMKDLYEEIISVEKRKNEKLFYLSLTTKTREELSLEFIDYLEELISILKSFRYALDPSNSIHLYLKAIEYEVKTKFNGFIQGIGISKDKEDDVFELLKNKILKEKSEVISAFRSSSVDELIYALTSFELYVKIYSAYLSQDEIREALRLRFELECLIKKSRENRDLLQKEIEEIDNLTIQLIEIKQEGLNEMIRKGSKFKNIFPNEFFRLNFQYNLLEKLRLYLKKNKSAYFFYNALLTNENRVLEELIADKPSDEELLISALGARLVAKNVAEKAIGKEDLTSKLKKIDLFKKAAKKDLLGSEIQAYFILDPVSLHQFLITVLEEDAKSENFEDFKRIYPYLKKYFGSSKEMEVLDASFKMLADEKSLLPKYKKFLWQRISLSFKEIEWEIASEKSEKRLKLGLDFEEYAIKFCDIYEEASEDIRKQISYAILAHSLYKIFENSMDHMLWLKEYVQKQHVDPNRQNLIIRSLEDLEKFGSKLQRDMKIGSVEDPKMHKIFHERLKDIFKQSTELQEQKEDSKSKENSSNKIKEKMEKEIIAPERPFKLSPSQAIRFVLEMESDDPSFKIQTYEREEGLRPW